MAHFYHGAAGGADRLAATHRRRHKWWPLIHRDANANLYVRALDAPAGTILHGITEHARPGDLISIARTASGNASAIKTSDLHTAREQFGQFADTLALDQQVSSARTREITDWRPWHPSGRR